MRGLIIRWLLNAVALWLTSTIVKGIEVQGLGPLLFAAIVLGILNAFLRPLLLLVTLPFNILTLGLLTFVINGAMLKIASEVVRGFEVHGFWSAVVGALLLSLISFLLNLFIGDSGRIEYMYVRRLP